jgi:hypothetical protein
VEKNILHTACLKQDRGGPLKRFIILLLLTAVTLLAGGVLVAAHAQSPGTDLKPTFISPTPGLYVHGWPAFTVSYPKEWVELPLTPLAFFRAGGVRPDLPPGVHLPTLSIGAQQTTFPLEDWARIYLPTIAQFGTDLKILSDKPSQLQDDTPAREAELEYVLKSDPSQGSIRNGPKVNTFILMVKKDLVWISIMLMDTRGSIGVELKKIAYSLSFLPGREEPVKVPPDVRAFLDMYCADVVGHDPSAIMAHYIDRFLQSGLKKAFFERSLQNNPAFPI